MKTLNVIPTLVLTAMILVITGFSTYAIKPAMAPAEHIQKVISETVKYPAPALKHGETGSVDVLFLMNDDGQLVIKKVWGDTPAIADDIKTQLSNVICRDVKFPYNQYYKISITFKLVG